jgi:hypothetical protein
VTAADLAIDAAEQDLAVPNMRPVARVLAQTFAPAGVPTAQVGTLLFGRDVKKTARTRAVFGSAVARAQTNGSWNNLLGCASAPHSYSL